jgi:Ni,Fe-hydrogenase III large subunit
MPGPGSTKSYATLIGQAARHRDSPCRARVSEQCYNRAPKGLPSVSYTLPLGPFDQLWRGPLQLVVSVEGERIRAVDDGEHWHSRGCAGRLRQLKLSQAYPLVNRVCGVHSQHHAMAWTMALEQLAQIEPPPRAQVLRTLVAEAERIASHLQDVARIVGATGLEREARPFVMLREAALECAQIITGRRLIHDFVRPGGVQDDLHRDECRALDARLVTLGKDIGRRGTAVVEHRAIWRRTSGVGVIAPEQLGAVDIVGWAARASGHDRDTRSDMPYAAYPMAPFEVIRYSAGDVHARLATLLGESFISVVVMRHVLAALPQSRWRGDLLDYVPPGSASTVVEAPGGRLSYQLVSEGERLSDVTISSSQAHTTALLRLALDGALVDDLALIVASLGHCTACAEA